MIKSGKVIVYTNPRVPYIAEVLSYNEKYGMYEILENGYKHNVSGLDVYSMAEKEFVIKRIKNDITWLQGHIKEVESWT